MDCRQNRTFNDSLSQNLIRHPEGRQQGALSRLLSSFENVVVSYSGGIDSHVLLHLCASCAEIKPKITAVYIHHGLQDAATDWGEHCRKVCAQLEVKFLILPVNAKAAAGESPEEAARNARYSALKPLVGKDDALLIAQHAEDQLETVLLQLFRGCGLKGLSAMPENASFGQGKLLRPLLHTSKVDIIEYAHRYDLKWVDDPTNNSSEFDRNFLRNEIIPSLKQRWQALDKTVGRSAQHCQTALNFIEHKLHKRFAQVYQEGDSSLNTDTLKDCSPEEQRLVVREWFEQLSLRMPSHDLTEKILGQVVYARADASPVIFTQGREIRRYRNSLRCIFPEALLLKEGEAWPDKAIALSITDRTTYELTESCAGIPKDLWEAAKVTVGFRCGGESIRLPKREGRHSLKKLYQEAGIAPWERAITPLFYLDGQLAAVGDYWISAEFYREQPFGCWILQKKNTHPED